MMSLERDQLLPTAPEVSIEIVVLYSGLFLWGDFRYFHGSPGCHEIFHTRKFFTHCVALSTRAQICTGDVLLWLFFATCSVLGPQSPLSQC